MKDIKDYFHLYIGCEVEVTLYLADVPDKTKVGKLIGAYVDQWEKGHYHPTVQVDFGFEKQRHYYYQRHVKLLLRPLSDMTEEERNERWQIIIQGEKVNLYEVMRWELSKSFDLFGLIEAGLAIDKTTTSSPSKEQQ